MGRWWRVEWPGLRMILQLVRSEERRQRLRQTRDMLDHIDEGNGEVTRRMQNAEAERRHEDHVTRRCFALVPEHDRPSEQNERQRDCGACMSRRLHGRP